MNKKLLILLILSLVAASIAVIYFVLFNRDNTISDTETVNKPFAVEKQDIDSVKLPAAFAKSFPTEPGSEVVQNYEVTTTDGRMQSTRIVTTKKPLSEAVADYKTYFTNLGWTATSTGNVSTVQMRKNNDALMIIGTIDTSTEINTIEVTITEAAK